MERKGNTTRATNEVATDATAGEKGNATKYHVRRHADHVGGG